MYPICARRRVYIFALFFFFFLAVSVHLRIRMDLAHRAEHTGKLPALYNTEVQLPVSIHFSLNATYSLHHYHSILSKFCCESSPTSTASRSEMIPLNAIQMFLGHLNSEKNHIPSDSHFWRNELCTGVRSWNNEWYRVVCWFAGAVENILMSMEIFPLNNSCSAYESSKKRSSNATNGERKFAYYEIFYTDRV